VLEAWFPGSEGGTAVANLLLASSVSGGKLPFTRPRDAGRKPLYYSHTLTQAPANQDKRYWNEEGSPLLPFGFGLSYAKFSISNLKVDRPDIQKSETIHVSVDVENLSNVAGYEVVQLYLHQQSGSSSRPVRELKGLDRIALKPHEKRIVAMPFGNEELSYRACAARDWAQDAAVFDLWVGEDSTASLHGTFTVAP
jgi:beta-glucosidase